MARRYTQAQNKATQKYILNNYDEIKVRIPKGEKEKYKAIAAANGKSLNQFVIECMETNIKVNQN